MSAGGDSPWRIYRRGCPGGAYPPMVLVHGFTGGTQSWTDVVRALPRVVPVLALSVPGHHRLAPACGDFAQTCMHLVAQCRQAMGALSAGHAEAAGQRRARRSKHGQPQGSGSVQGELRPHLVGYSLGARLCLHMLIGFPQLFGSASLIGAHPGLDDEASRRLRQAEDARWQALLREQGLDVFLRRWDAQPIFARQRQRYPGRLLRQRTWRRQHDPAQLAQSLASAGLGMMPSAGPALPRLKRAVQWIVGAQDTKFLGLATGATHALPDATLQVLAECGHNPLVELPATLASLIMHWYRQHRLDRLPRLTKTLC